MRKVTDVLLVVSLVLSIGRGLGITGKDLAFWDMPTVHAPALFASSTWTPSDADWIRSQVHLPHIILEPVERSEGTMMIMRLAAELASHPGSQTCSDAISNGDESDVDCGGSCAPCFNGRLCYQNGDCQSGNCRNGICANNGK